MWKDALCPFFLIHKRTSPIATQKYLFWLPWSVLLGLKVHLALPDIHLAGSWIGFATIKVVGCCRFDIWNVRINVKTAWQHTACMTMARLHAVMQFWHSFWRFRCQTPHDRTSCKPYCKLLQSTNSKYKFRTEGSRKHMKLTFFDSNPLYTIWRHGILSPYSSKFCTCSRPRVTPLRSFVRLNQVTARGTSKQRFWWQKVLVSPSQMSIFSGFRDKNSRR